MPLIEISLDRGDAEKISADDFSFVSNQANLLYEKNRPIADALGRVLETLMDEIETALSDEEPELGEDTKATINAARMLDGEEAKYDV